MTFEHAAFKYYNQQENIIQRSDHIWTREDTRERDRQTERKRKRKKDRRKDAGMKR